ncbi:MAG: PilZ domain-containing protein [Phycisphaerae bacterium]
MTSTDETRQRWLESARQDPDTDNFTGKRQHLRFRWPAQLQVHVANSADAEGTAEVCYVTGRDISELGVGFHCRRELQPHTRVDLLVDGEHVKVPAQVRHCTQTVSGFFVGADFVDA